MWRCWRMFLVSALALGLALPAAAQMMGPMGQGGPMRPGAGERMGGGGPAQPAGPGPREGRGAGGPSHEGPLISIMLDHKQELGLNAEQEKKLRDLRRDFEKDSTRRGAEIRVAEIELDSLLEQDKWDLGKIEPKVKQIAGLQADLRMARLKTLEAGRAILAPEQLEKLKQVGHRMRTPGGPGPAGPGQPMRPGQPMGPGGPPPRY